MAVFAKYQVEGKPKLFIMAKKAFDTTNSFLKKRAKFKK